MLSRDDELRLEEIEHDLQLSDPRFVARMRRRFRPKPPIGYRITFWVLAAMIIIPLTALGGAAGAIVSLLLIGFAAIVMFWLMPRHPE